ncbi:ABC transporter permease, partial [Pirellulales bacterium]|nr:ABC transporter permease [Pirellulales bacterium]
MKSSAEQPNQLAAAAARWPQSFGRLILEYVGLIGALAGLILFFSLLTDHFWSLGAMSTIANQTADLILVAVGMTFVLLVAGIDLSVGSVMALCGSLLGVAMVSWGWSLPVAIAATVGLGLLCGLATGGVSVWLKVPSFIVSLAMLEIARGGAYYLTDSQTIYIGTAVESMGAPIKGWGLSPAFLVAVVVVVLGQWILSATVFGRHLFAIGGNALAARYSGVRVEWTRIAAFAILGALSGLAGVFHTAKLTAADPNSGIGLELSAIAAVVIGGTSLSGGRGSVVRSFLGVMIIAVLQSGLAQVGATEPTKRTVTGLVILVAVIADVLR